MKEIKKFSMKFAKILLLTLVVITDLANPIKVLADSLNSDEVSVGSIRLGNEVSETGSVTVTGGSLELEKEGDVQVTKTVSTINAAEGIYNVTFKIKGKDKEDSSTAPVYVVVVFDKSGSMNCVKYSYDWDGSKYCSDHGNKWTNAVKGAKDFASSLNKSLNKGETKYANIALVQFSGSRGEWIPGGLFGMGGHYEDTAWNDASVVRGFATTDFSSINFGSADGGTNLGEGLSKALGLFTDKSNNIPKDAKKYVVVIGDGRPTYYSNSNGMTEGDGSSDPNGDSEKYANEKATALKNAGVEIFSIGYDITDDTSAQEILKNVATTDVINPETGKEYVKHAVLAGEANIAEIFTELAKNLSTSVAGKNATITDNVGTNFRVIENKTGVASNNNNKIISEVVSEITEDETEVLSFNIQIDPDTETGWHKTNEGFNLVYTDYNGNEQIIEITEDPEVYWKQKEYSYVVNYYKDEITNKDDANYLGSVSYSAVKDTVITNDNIDKSLFIPTGYEYNKTVFGPNGEVSITITNNGTHNEINVLYTAMKFSYKVEYYKDNETKPFNEINVSDVTYNTTVSSSSYYLEENDIPTGYVFDDQRSDNKDYTITNNNVVIKIYYKKNSYDYTIKYWFDGVNEFERSNKALYGDTLLAKNYVLSDEELAERNKDDFFLNPNMPFDPSEIAIDINGNVINIYYVSTHLKDNSESIVKSASTLNNVISSSNQVVNYEVNYRSVINNVKKNSIVAITIIDTLPYEIDEDNSNLTYNGNTGIYNKENKTITWTIYKNISEFTEELNINETIKYSVIYKDFASISSSQDNTLVNIAYGVTKVNNKDLSKGVEGTASVDTLIKGKLIVKYLEKDTNKVLSNEEVTTDKVGSSYQVNAKNIFGYTYDSVNGNEKGVYSEEDTVVIYYYTKNAGEIEEGKTTKEGNSVVESIDGVFNYTINSSAVIKDYVGDATLTVIDNLPYKLDLAKSNIDNRCSYDNNNTITCVVKYNDIKESDYTDGVYEINETFNLELVFVGVDKDIVINKESSTIKLDSNTNTTTDEVETEVSKGTLKVIYKDTNDVVLLETDKMTDLAGKEYKTNMESFYGYTFKENKGDATSGKYVANKDLVVYYIYEKNIGGSNEQIEKVGPREVEGIDSRFDYEIKYNAVIKDYIGEANLTIVDTLPYEIDLEKSIFNKNICTYDKDSLTITCNYGTYNITKENNKISINEPLKLYYIGIDSNEVYNGVNATLTYGSTIKKSENGVYTDVKEGLVNVRYVTISDNKYMDLVESDNISGLVGSTYTTSPKDIKGYELVDVIGEEEGVITLEDNEVIYVYKLKELPPKTGIMINTTNTNSIISLLLIAFLGIIIKRMR